MLTERQKTIIAVLSVLAAVLLAAAVFALVRHTVKTDPSPAQETENLPAAAEASSDTDPAESETAASTTAAAPQTTDAPAADTAGIVTPTADELKEVTGENGFVQMLNLTFMPESAGSFTIDYDSSRLNTASVKHYLFFLDYSRIYISHYGDPQTVSADLGNTGKKRDYWVYPEENILWLARNVLNFTGEFDPAAFEAPGSGGNPSPCTYKDGMYYFSIPGFDTFQAYPDKISASPLADGKYKLTVSYRYPFDYNDVRPVSGTGEVIVALKEADGKRFWSVYSYKADLNTDGDVEEQSGFDSIVAAFRKKWQDGTYLFKGFAYHDIDEDGQAELIVNDGTCEADNTYYFYALRNGNAVDLGTVSAWHSGLTDSDHRLLRYFGMGGEGTYTYITVSGSSIKETQGGDFSFPPVPDFGEPIPFTNDG